MSRNYSKIEYKCASECNYGSCEKTNVFVMRYNNTIDIAEIFYQHHKEDGNVFEKIGFFNDTDIEMLKRLIVEPGELLTVDEIKLLPE